MLLFRPHTASFSRTISPLGLRLLPEISSFVIGVLSNDPLMTAGIVRDSPTNVPSALAAAGGIRFGCPATIISGEQLRRETRNDCHGRCGTRQSVWTAAGVAGAGPRQHAAVPCAPTLGRRTGRP